MPTSIAFYNGGIYDALLSPEGHICMQYFLRKLRWGLVYGIIHMDTTGGQMIMLFKEPWKRSTLHWLFSLSPGLVVEIS